MHLKKLLVLVGIGLNFPLSLASHSLADSNPTATLHTLQAAQDSLAKGDKNAAETQARLLGELGAQLSLHGEKFLEERQNFYTILLYLINGGNPDHVQHLLDKIPPTGTDRHLLDGVLAYMQGREGDFHAALAEDNLEDMALPSALRASIYLALTPYLSRKNPELADARLDYVRLVAPGSLFEEAALRRQIKIAATLKDKNKIGRLVRHYTIRFPHSPYLRDFWSEVMDAISTTQNMFEEQELATLLTPMPDKLRYLTYLQLARLALLDGRLEQAETHANTAAMLANLQGIDGSLPQFYQLAAQAATVQADQVANPLQNIPLEGLPPRDHALARAARNVARAVSDRPIMDHISHPEATNQQGTHDDDTDKQIDTILQQLNNKLNEIDTALEKTR